MADTKDFPVLNFGIEETNMVGDAAAAEAFLSGEVEEIEKEEEKKEPEKKEEKKIEAKKEEVEIDPFGEEEEEEKEEEKKEEEKKLEDKKEGEGKKEGEEDEEEGQVEENQYAVLAKDLFKLGVFSEQEKEGEIKSGKDLLDRFQLQGQLNATQWLDNFLARHGEDRKELFDAIFISGVDPEEYLPVFNQVQQFEKLDLTDVENQKSVFREFYKRTGLKPETIEKNLQKTLDYGDLEDNISELHEQIVQQDKEAMEEMRVSKERQEAEKKRSETEYRTSLQKLLNTKVKEQEFKGIPLNETKAREVVDFLTTPKYRTPNGQLLTEFDKFILESKKPENIESRVIISLLKMDGFDFSKIEKKGVSKETNELFTSLERKAIKSKNRSLEPKKQASGFQGI